MEREEGTRDKVRVAVGDEEGAREDDAIEPCAAVGNASGSSGSGGDDIRGSVAHDVEGPAGGSSELDDG